MNEEEIRLKILHLVAEVAATEDNNVPILLKQYLQGLLDNHAANSELGIKIRKDLWNYDVLHVCSLALLQDFSLIQDDWSTAAVLCSVVCQCCDGLDLTSSIEFNETFLPNTVDNMLNLLFRVEEMYIKEEASKKHVLFRNFKEISDSLLWMVSYAHHLSSKVLESKRVLQMLMMEDEETSLLILVVLHCILKKEKDILKKIDEDAYHSLLDELVYKISASEDLSVGRSACQLLLLFIDRQPSIVELLASRKYRGLKTYLSKWSGKGFDQDLRKLTSILEAGNIAQAELLKKDLAASVIQAFYKSHKERERLKKAKQGVIKFQRLFRRYRERKHEERKITRWRREKELQEDISKKRDFRQSLNRNLETLGCVPANKVNTYLVEQQEEAATKIQAVFRGIHVRKQLKTLKKERNEIRAAIKIQRMFRRYLERRKSRDKAPLKFGPPGLDDARRAEIQEIILRYRENKPKKGWSFETVKEKHYETQRLLGNHLMLHGKYRKKEQSREALLAKLNVDAELLLASPSLKDVNLEMTSIYTSRSTPIITKAKLNHSEEMVKMKAPWWKKFGEMDDIPSLRNTSLSEEKQDLNF